MLSKKSFCIAERKFSELYPFADGFKEAFLADAPEIIVHGRRPDLHHFMAERPKETLPMLGPSRIEALGALQGVYGQRRALPEAQLLRRRQGRSSGCPNLNRTHIRCACSCSKVH